MSYTSSFSVSLTLGSAFFAGFFVLVAVALIF
jgi:hypothetical protein